MCSNSSLFDYGLLAYFPRTYYVTLDIAILPSLLSGQGDRYLGTGTIKTNEGTRLIRSVVSFPRFRLIV